MSARRATRDDVARLAKTSTAVVSYVINNGPRQVSDERRRRVLAAMAALDYYPNAHARSLAATETRTIGMIVPNISNAYFSELALAVEDVAVADGRLLFLGNSSEDSEREIAYLQSFIQQRVDGILIVGVAQTSTITTARRAGIPVVIVDRELGEPDLTTVSIAHREAGRRATHHLVEHGYESIACVVGPEELPVAEQRLQGWTDALSAAGQEPGVVVRTPFSIDGGRAAFAQLLDAGKLPRAAFVATDDQARGMIAAAHDARLSVPDDLAIVSIDGTREGAQGSPSLTAVRQPYRRLAEAALGALRDTDTDGSPRHVYVDADLVVGRSCGCRP